MSSAGTKLGEFSPVAPFVMTQNRLNMSGVAWRQCAFSSVYDTFNVIIQGAQKFTKTTRDYIRSEGLMNFISPSTELAKWPVLFNHSVFGDITIYVFCATRDGGGMTH